MTHEIRRAGRPANTIERLHEEFRRRVKTQGSLPSEAAALVLRFSLVASSRSSCKGSTAGKIATVLREPMLALSREHARPACRNADSGIYGELAWRRGPARC
jgi:transposase-like protein